MSGSIHADVEGTVRIGGRRFEQSPFFDCWANDETVLGVYAGRFYPVANGDDVVQTYWTLRHRAVCYDVPEKPMQIEGPDVLPFLEKVFARRIEGLSEGRARYAIACTHDGGTFMDGILFRLGRDRYWYVQPDGELETWLSALSDGFDVTVSDPSSRVLQVQGPASFGVMSELTGGALDESMKYFHSGYFDIGGQRLYVSRTGWTGELGYEIYTDGADTDCPKLFTDVMTAGEAHGLVFGSAGSMEIRRIEAGILDNLTDFDTTMTPFEAGLGRFVDLDKPGFVGREALLARTDRRTRLLGLTCATGTPAYRGDVLDGDRVVGHVTAAAWSPELDAGIGYVRFDQAGDWVGRVLGTRIDGGGEAECEVVELPFHDRDKQLPRIIP